MVLFTLTSAVLEVSSAVVYFVADKTIRGIGRLLWSPEKKNIEYDNTYLMVSELEGEDNTIKDELSCLKNELEEIKKLLKER
tara:strand:+ start:49 stop:294 length:246 start_codon:yes stop_codon:yes gene_type:complete